MVRDWWAESRASWFGMLVGAVMVTLTPSFAFAQIPPPDTFNPVDQHGVNLATGKFKGPDHTLSIGQPGQGGLSATAYYDSSAGTWRHSLAGGIATEPLIGAGSDFPWYMVTIMGSSQAYWATTDGQFAPIDATGTLTLSGGIYTHTALDGTVAVIRQSLGTQSPYRANRGQIETLTRPSGEKLTFHYTLAYSSEGFRHNRLQSVTNNFGYQIHFQYVSDVYDGNWGELAKITAFNSGIDYCDPTAFTCAFSRTWPSLTFARVVGAERSVTDALNQTSRYFFSGNQVTGYRRPSQSSGDSLTIAWNSPYPNSDKISSVSNGTGAWNYGYSNPPPDPQPIFYEVVTDVTDPHGHTTQVRNGSWNEDPLIGRRVYRITRVTNALNQITNYDYNELFLLSEIINPEGDKIVYGYSARGDITSRGRMPKPGSPQASDTVSATYPTPCGNPIICGRPTSITDSRGVTTDYTYDPTHGGVLTETLPAPDASSARPQNRYTYQPLAAWYRTSASSAQVQSAAPVYLPTAMSACAAGTSCTGSAQEVRTTTIYQAGSANAHSNLLPVATSIGSGDGALTATTTMTWDANGDQKTVDGPLPGGADTAWYAYDVMRRALGQIAPDPDGGGGLLFPATRTTYNADGQVISVERGTTTGQGDSAWAAFSSLERTDTAYDAQARKVRDTEVVGAASVSVTQYAYDSDNRLLCSALRMNPASYGSLPASACDHSTAGANGPDRITRNTYDNADRLTVVQNAYGTPLAQATRTQAWTANGQVDWVEDANGNRSDYAYDGLDRLYRLYFPETTLGAHTASTTDFEQYGYDANDNPVSRRLRDGQTITYTYDFLNRETVRTTPGGGTADDVFSTYDNLGRRLSARFDNVSSGSGVTWTWDALGRPLTETTALGTLTSRYDLAGRRTRLTWPAVAGGYVDYTWDLAGRMVQVRENGATSGPGLLADFAYDNLGRPTALARGNGAGTSWSYVANTRNWSMTQNLSGSADDLTLGFAFSPAAQVTERAISNTGYSFTPPTLSETYARDGLNRYTAVAGVAFTYDGRQNLTDDGPNAYAYDVENRLTAVSGASAMTLAYDPLGRLKQTVSGTTTTRFLYDGDRLIGEYDAVGTTVTARYAHGAGVDQPLVWYEGPGLTDRRWLHADAQGSIIAVSGATGAIVGSAYSYSPYGEPDAANGWGGSRFRYTGQISLRHAPLWHYKARAYNPALGRFLQTDPVGYADQINLYAYVANDPVNRTDPTGMVMQDRFDQQSRRRDIGDAAADRQNREAADRVVGAVRGIINDIKSDPIGAAADGLMIAGDIILGGPTGESAVGIGLRRGAREGAEAVAEGVVYRRTNTGTGRCYIGRCNSDQLYSRRQRAHDRAQGTRHEYEVVERAQPGRALREAEQRHIDANGGPTNRSNSNGGLENRRNEIDPRRRRE